MFACSGNQPDCHSEAKQGICCLLAAYPCWRERFYTVPVSHGSNANQLREITTHSAEETIAFGRTLAELLSPPKLVLLRGDLGAGKTTLVKGIAAVFEAASEEDVTSPTFTLIHEYRGPRANLFHIDLYRIDTPRELDTLALDDLRSENSILLIEWERSFRDWCASAMRRLRWKGKGRVGEGFGSPANAQPFRLS